MKDFANLHEHTTYSALDGAAKISDKVQRAKELGQTALGISDHGWMAGVVEFDYQCRSNDIHPVIGCELYISEGDHTDKSGANYHQTLFAMNQIGYKNLMTLSSEGYINGFYRKPRISKDFLASHSEGIICLSGCMASELSTLVLKDDMAEATRLAKWYHYVFGDRYYIELQDHKLDNDPKLIKGLIDLAQELKIDMTASNDGHYVNKEDADAHQVLLCVQTASTLNKPSMSYGSNEFYLKSYDEMHKSFGHVSGVLENSLVISNRCDVTIGQPMVPLPHPPISVGLDVNTHFKRLLYGGLIERYGDPLPQNVVDRVKYELEPIQSAGFVEYFLLLHDIIRFCREKNIIYGVRGSVGGSIVAYGLKITNIDPLYYGLSFTRFINPARIEKADIDFDVADNRRSEIIQYAKEAYGEENVCQILALGTMAAKNAIRDVGRAMEIPLSDVTTIAKMVPDKNPDQSKVTLLDALEKVPEMRDIRKNNRKLFEYALKLEGTYRQASTHAAGLIISSRPIVETVPLYTAPKMNGVVTTQFTMEYLDRVGLTKIDILGLTQLSIMSIALNLIGNKNLTFDTIPLDDKSTFDLISSGNTFAIFQLGEGGMRRLVKNDKPKTLEEVAVLLALYRPGSLPFVDSYVRRHHGTEKVEYPHHLIEPFLKNTYGIPVYQEQIIDMVKALGGFSPGEADIIRKNIGKKKIEKMKEHRVDFIKGAKNQGIAEKEADELWKIIDRFSGYGFSLSHAIAYSVMTVKSAYLKANYPNQYMVALLSAERSNQEKVTEAIGECRRMDIPILNPDINESNMDFTLVGASIRFGLSAIKGLGDGVAQSIVNERKQHGPYKNMMDFLERHNTKTLNKRTIEALSKSGALDKFENRNTLLNNIDDIIKYVKDYREWKKSPQMGLFPRDVVNAL